jgi:hypothetical protein
MVHMRAIAQVIPTLSLPAVPRMLPKGKLQASVYLKPFDEVPAMGGMQTT